MYGIKLAEYTIQENERAKLYVALRSGLKKIPLEFSVIYACKAPKC